MNNYINYISIIQIDPNQRSSAKDLLEHSWLNEGETGDDRPYSSAIYLSDPDSDHEDMYEGESSSMRKKHPDDEFYADESLSD